MRSVATLGLLAACLDLTPRLAAQATSARALGESALYSLYVKRHAMTVEFAELATARRSDGEVRKAAEKLAQAHREAGEKLERAAQERHLTLALPERDTSVVLLAQARKALEGKSEQAFDATWSALAYDWLSTLVLDNNRTVKPNLDPALKSIAEAHTTWLFHQMSDMDKLRKKFK